MKILNQSYEILFPASLDTTTAREILQAIELAGRTCYKSEDRITETSASDFVKMIIKRGHESVLEHRSISVKFVVDRGVSHEIVRHRIASFSQESTRYCSYGNEKHGNSINVIDISSHFKNPTSKLYWESAMKFAEMTYLSMIENGESPQIARSVLPNSLKTEIVVTANLREWRTIFKQRCASGAHPQMQEVMKPLFEELCKFLPEIFEDLKETAKNEHKAPAIIPIVVSIRNDTKTKTKLSHLKVGDFFIFKSHFHTMHWDFDKQSTVLIKKSADECQCVYTIVRQNLKSTTVRRIYGKDQNGKLNMDHITSRVLKSTEMYNHPDPFVKKVKI